MSHHLRRILTAAAFFVAASLLYKTWRQTQPEYSFYDLLKGQQSGSAGAPAPKLTDADVPSMAKFSEESTKLAAAVLPCVVSINTATVTPVPIRDFFGILRDYRYSITPGLGSGVIVSKDGYVVTNFHVIKDAAQIQIITNEGEKHKADVIGSDPEADIAVLRMVGGKDFPALPFANSDEVKVGQLVFAVGNPFGLTGTVTQGIISATRKLSGSDRTLLQTDTVINPGNSGGPLVNIRGEIVGINLAIYAGQQSIHTWQGVGLTIPANEAKSAYEAIMKGHTANPSERGGYLGLKISETPVTVDKSVVSSGVGALVVNVDPRSPAAKVGIQSGDIVIKLNNKPFASPDELNNLIHQTSPGLSINVTVVRGSRISTVPVTMGRTP